MIQSFRDLDIYKESYDLMLEIHEIVKNFPIYERNDLSSQMRRASKSCPANIAEGWGKRSSEKEFKKFLNIAMGSANEMEMHLETTRDLKYAKAETCNRLIKRYKFVGGKIVNLQKIWRTF